MCGIMGFYGEYDEEFLYHGIEKIAHRGPDDSGMWLSPSTSVGLAHRRLSS